MSSAIRKAADLGVAVIGLALLSHVVLGNNSAKIIQEIGQAQSRMIKVMIGERIIESRDVPRFEMLLGDITDEAMTELFAGLSDADLDWVEHHLDLTYDPCEDGRCTDPAMHAEGGHDR